MNLVEHGCASRIISFFLPVYLSVCLSPCLLVSVLLPRTRHSPGLAWPGLVYPGRTLPIYLPTYHTYTFFSPTHSLHSLHSSPFFTLSSTTLTHSLAFSHRSLDTSHFFFSSAPPILILILILILIAILSHTIRLPRVSVPVSYCVQSVDLISQRI